MTDDSSDHVSGSDPAIDEAFSQIVQLTAETSSVFSWLSSTQTAPDSAIEDLREDLSAFSVVSWVALPVVISDADDDFSDDPLGGYATSMMQLLILAVRPADPRSGFVMLWEGSKLDSSSEHTFEVRQVKVPLRRIISVSTSALSSSDSTDGVFRGFQLIVEYEGVSGRVKPVFSLDDEDDDGEGFGEESLSFSGFSLSSNKLIIADEDPHSYSEATAQLKSFSKKLCEYVY
ncbi:MAG: hypothetical protein KDD60_12140 [Bdellovibrionales bacterium]|nr:hypothetical protein [Bdellovibrionales bacterium]